MNKDASTVEDLPSISGGTSSTFALNPDFDSEFMEADSIDQDSRY